MTINLLAPNLISVTVTSLLWYWAVKRWGHLKTPELNGEIRQQNLYASIAFSALIFLEMYGYANVNMLSRISISFLTASTYVMFAVVNCRDKEGFWRKKRNRLMGGSAAFLYAMITPFFVKESGFLPLTFSLLVAHICHNNSTRMFMERIQDIEGLKAKLVAMDGQLRLIRAVHAAMLETTSLANLNEKEAASLRRSS